MKTKLFSGLLSKSFLKKILQLFLILPIAVGVSFCAPANINQNVTPGFQNKGSLSLLLTDFPLNNKDVSAVLVSINSIEVHSDAKGWVKVVDYGEAGKSFDLLKLQNGVTAPLGSFHLDPGEYQQIRLILNDSNFIEVTADEVTTLEQLQTPSAAMTGIKLNRPFTIDSRGYTVLTIDFNAEKSIHENNGQGYKLQPVISIIDSQTTPGAAVNIPATGGSAEIIGEFVLNFPDGALAEDTKVEIFPIDPATLNPPFSSRQVAGGAYNVLPSDTALQSDATVTFHYDAGNLNGVLEEKLQVALYDSATGKWTPVASTVDTTQKTVTASVNRLGAITLLGQGAGAQIHPAAVRGAGFDPATGSSLIEVPDKVAATITPAAGTTISSVTLNFFKDGSLAAPVGVPMNLNALTGEHEALLDTTWFYGDLPTESSPLGSVEVYIEVVDSNGAVSVAPGAALFNDMLTWHKYNYNADQDNDNMNDRWELDSGLDPTIDDSQADLDSDGLSNLAEYARGSHPNVFDALISGTITGLAANEIIELTNNTETISVVAQAETQNFNFGGRVSSGSTYNISIKTAPSGKTCTLTGGQGTITNAHIASIVVTCEAPTEGFISVAAGSYHKAAIKADGSLWAWGRNNYGQLGVGYSPSATSKPLRVGTENNWKIVAANHYHTLAIKTDGTLWAWGRNQNGQLGIGSISKQYTPRQVGTAGDWASISASHAHTLAIKTDGTLWAMGYNTYGQLGNGNSTQQRYPVIIGSNFAQAKAGSLHSMAIKTDGSLWAWGDNANAQLGDGTTTRRYLPKQISGGQWADIAPGSMFSVAITADGKLYAWGTSHYYYGPIFSTYGVRKYPVYKGSGYVKACANSNFVMAIRSSGGMSSSGYNYQGQLGNGNNSPRRTLGYAYGSNWTDVDCGSNGTIGVQGDGTLWTWGYGAYGQNGNGSSSNQYKPVNIQIVVPTKAAGTGGGTMMLSSGYNYNMLIREDGSLWAWGKNDYGQLGLGDTTKREIPTRVGKDNDWKFVSGGYGFTLAVKQDGSLWAWGRNSHYQLGYFGSTSNFYSPMKVSSLKWKAVSAGGVHSLGITTDGKLYAWGYNGNAQLGRGNTYNYRSMVTPSGTTTSKYKMVAAGYHHSLAIREDQIPFGWGVNYYGQTGAGSSSSRVLRPAPIGGYGIQFNQIYSMYNHSMAIDSNGKLMSWGYNRYGQLGNGSTYYRRAPVDVFLSKNVVDASAGYEHSVAVTDTGELYTWGRAYSKPYGRYTRYSYRTYPTLFDDNSYTGVEAGPYNSLGLRNNANLFGWGQNRDGQLGIEKTSTEEKTPVEILFP